MYVRTYLLATYIDTEETTGEREREGGGTVYDAVQLESNAPLVASRPLPLVQLSGANYLRPYVCAGPSAERNDR